MNLTFFAVALIMIVGLEDVGISEPVFEIGAASESNDDGFEIVVETNDAKDFVGNDHLTYFEA